MVASPFAVKEAQIIEQRHGRISQQGARARRDVVAGIHAWWVVNPMVGTAFGYEPKLGKSTAAAFIFVSVCSGMQIAHLAVSWFRDLTAAEQPLHNGMFSLQALPTSLGSYEID